MADRGQDEETLLLLTLGSIGVVLCWNRAFCPLFPSEASLFLEVLVLPVDGFLKAFLERGAAHDRSIFSQLGGTEIQERIKR